MRTFFVTIAGVIPIFILALMLQAGVSRVILEDYTGIGVSKTWLTGSAQRVTFLVRFFQLMLGLGIIVEVSALAAIASATDRPPDDIGDWIAVYGMVSYVFGLFALLAAALQRSVFSVILQASEQTVHSSKDENEKSP